MHLLIINSISLAPAESTSPSALWIVKRFSFNRDRSIVPESILRIVLFLQRLQSLQSPRLIPVKHLQCLIPSRIDYICCRRLVLRTLAE